MIVSKVLRMLGTRYGIAAILLLFVVAVVAVARVSATSGFDSDNPAQDPDDSAHSVEPGAPDDGYADGHSDHPDGGSAGPEADDLPPDAVETAESFAAAWVDTSGKSQQDWHEEVAPYATEDVQTQLEVTEPENVPAEEITGEPQASGNNVEIETDGGLLILRLSSHTGSWLVAGIDFERN